MKYPALAFSVVAVALAGLAGCPVTQLNRSPQSSPLARPASVAVVGDFKHAPSGYVFPVRVAEFQRVAVVQYDTAGLDVSAGYNDALPGCAVVLTIYVYPTPRMTFIGADPAAVRSLEAGWLNRAYGEAKGEIVHVHPDAMLESEGSATQGGIPGEKATYLIGDARSELFMFVVEHAWFLEYRASYPKQCTTQAHQALGAFGAAWRGRAS